MYSEGAVVTCTRTGYGVSHVGKELELISTELQLTVRTEAVRTKGVS